MKLWTYAKAGQLTIVWIRRLIDRRTNELVNLGQVIMSSDGTTG